MDECLVKFLPMLIVLSMPLYFPSPFLLNILNYNYIQNLFVAEQLKFYFILLHKDYIKPFKFLLHFHIPPFIIIFLSLLFLIHNFYPPTIKLFQFFRLFCLFYFFLTLSFLSPTKSFFGLFSTLSFFLPFIFPILFSLADVFLVFLLLLLLSFLN